MRVDPPKKLCVTEPHPSHVTAYTLCKSVFYDAGEGLEPRTRTGRPAPPHADRPLPRRRRQGNGESIQISLQLTLLGHLLWGDGSRTCYESHWSTSRCAHRNRRSSCRSAGTIECQTPRVLHESHS